MGMFKRIINGFLQSDDVVLNSDGSVPVSVIASTSGTPAVISLLTALLSFNVFQGDATNVEFSCIAVQASN